MNHSFTEDEVRHNVLSLKDGSPGYDNIDSKLLKVVSPYIVKPLVHIFNLSLDQ